jgi:CubicO group peptidase (beta-lactamase class C family)
VKVRFKVKRNNLHAANQALLENHTMISQAQIDEALRRARGYVESGNLPLVVVGVSDATGLRVRVGYGEGAREEDSLCDGVFALASISKSIAGTVVARLYQQGILDYDTPIAEYVPEFGTSEVRKGILLSQIFNHSTGLPSAFVDASGASDFSAGKVLELLSTQDLVYEPGTQSCYSTHTYQLLNAAIQRRLGLTMEEALQRYVCEPCGMTATGFYPDPARALPVVDHPVPEGRLRGLFERMEMSGGGMWSTVDDLLALGCAWLTPNKLVSPEVFAKVTAMLPGLPVGGNPEVLSRRTLGWNREIIGAFPHQPASGFFHGGATGTLLWLDPEADLVFVFLTNRWGCGNDQAFNTLDALYASC